MKAEQFLTEKSDWFDKSPGGEKLYFESEVIRMMNDYANEALRIHDVVGRSEQLKAEDKDLPFADYLEKWYEPPRYEKVYDRKDGKGTDTDDEVIKNYIRAFRL